MNILIKETGELRSLSFIDWHDGQEYTEQLISASGEDPNFLFVCAALGLQPISKAEYDPFVHL